MRLRIHSFLLVLFLSLSSHVFGQLPEVAFGECAGGMATPGNGDEEQLALEEIKKGNYEIAEQMIAAQFRSGEENPHLLYLLGEVGFRNPESRNIRATEAFWDRCLEICPNYSSELKYMLGRIKLNNGKIDEAMLLLEDYINDPDSDGEVLDAALDAYDRSIVIQDLMAHPVEYNVSVVRGVSTPNGDEYLTTFSPDGQMAFFTRRMGNIETFTKSTFTGRFYDTGQPMPPPFNRNYNEGSPTITADNRLLVFTSCEVLDNEYRNCDLFYSIRNGDQWSEIRSVGSNINFPDSWESQPSLSPNGDRLYFASNREGGLGGIDIYVSQRQSDGSWGDPQNLGAPVNTEGNEKSPFIHSDSRTLYFAAQGEHLGMGGYDLFYAHQIGPLEYDEPQNLGYPINTYADEVGLIVSLEGDKAYFNSNSEDGKGLGGWDLFQFTLPAAARPQEVAIVRGVLKDENGNPVTDAQLTVRNVTTREEQQLDVDRRNGEYTVVVNLDESEDVIIKAERAGASFSTRYIDVDEIESGMVEADLDVVELEIGREYRLNDINFETNSFELNDNALVIIEEFASFLKSSPNVTVDIQGHTDNVGGEQANMALSNNRARVVYERLLALGIPASQMTHNGFGETRPVASNSREQGRAKNRRTVFVITGL